MAREYWNRPSSKRLYEQLKSDVDNINHANDLAEKARTDAQKKRRDAMQKPMNFKGEK